MTRDRVTGEALFQTSAGWLHLHTPSRIIEARTPERVAKTIEEVEAIAKARGMYAAGFVTYEAAAAFGLAVVRPRFEDPPLAWFALFPPEHVAPVDGPDRGAEYEIRNVRPTVGRRRFEDTFARIKRYIAAGDTYQVNYTFRLRGEFAGCARDLFADLVEAQRGNYAAFVQSRDYSICSASPELFFSRREDKLCSRPMKGTSRRGRTRGEDRERARELHVSAKQRAENVMIVDMVRNDLGRVAEIGSVEVPDLFSVERYPNVWQMTSEVTARSKAGLAALFAALHPCASVTGAPKVRTMQLIAELEGEPRGVYTGAIGLVEPDGTARFSVAIRTAVVHRATGILELGIGSGIVWDSSAGDEYDECLLKGSVLGPRPPAFDLLETIRWTPADGFFLLDRHLDRVCESAGYFGYQADRRRIAAALHEAIAGASGPQRVRLLVDREGRPRVEATPLVASRHLVVRLAADPVDPADVHLFHKTTERRVYDRARVPGFDDVILWNPARQITESTMANVVVEIGGRRLTPTVECGLLGGTFRAELLARGEVEEGIVTIADIPRASRLWLVNSVHGWRQATCVDDVPAHHGA